MNSNETTHVTNPLDGITATITQALHQASQQAEQTINDARQQADTIIADAREQAEHIINDAHEQAKQITDSAQADARARDDMERASLAIQEHAAALHTLALGLAGRETTPPDNTGDASVNSGDDNAGDTDNGNGNENTNDAGAMPPAPTATTLNHAANDSAPTITSRANATTTRRADGTTRKLAPWEQPQDEQLQDKPAPDQEETPTNNAATIERNDEPEHVDATRDATAPTWDVPLIIDAPLQL